MQRMHLCKKRFDVRTTLIDTVLKHYVILVIFLLDYCKVENETYSGGPLTKL